jgi:hypothetical protein
MRFRPLGLLLSGVVVASSACSMDATAPSSLVPSNTAARTVETRNGGGDWTERATASRAGVDAPSTYVVTVDPRRENVLRFGDYTLELPSNAICSRSSGYGLEMFDLDCKTERHPVTITALVRSTVGGIPRIDLMPEMRFSPKRVVTLTLNVAHAQRTTSSPRILYCATLSTTTCIDEAELDPTLATHVDTAAGTVFRRIKHFSGYFVEW